MTEENVISANPPDTFLKIPHSLFDEHIKTFPNLLIKSFAIFTVRNVLNIFMEHDIYLIS